MAETVDLARLIALVAQEVIAATQRPVSRCACHAVADDCCPNRLQGVLDAGASRIGVHAPASALATTQPMIGPTIGQSCAAFGKTGSKACLAGWSARPRSFAR